MVESLGEKEKRSNSKLLLQKRNKIDESWRSRSSTPFLLNIEVLRALGSPLVQYVLWKDKQRLQQKDYLQNTCRLGRLEGIDGELSEYFRVMERVQWFILL